MAYKSLESQIKATVLEARQSKGRKMLDDWQRRVNRALKDLQPNDLQPKKEEDKPVEEGVDYEGGMAKTQLMAIATKAKAMADSLGEEEQLEAWIQTKISLADDYIGTVHDVMMHDKNKGRVK